MDGMIKVSPELLISTAGEFSNQGTTINTLTGEMLQLATGLASAWQGDGATAYITKFKGLENSIQLMVRMIQEHATDLEEIRSDSYLQRERNSDAIIVTADDLVTDVIQ